MDSDRVNVQHQILSLVIFVIFLKKGRVEIKTQISLSKTHFLTGSFAFASYYGNHMVLQRGPQRANVWGYSPHLGERVTVTVADHSVSTTVVTGHVTKGGVWQVKLPAIINPGPYVITASSHSGTIQLHDVLFGDVWICSGQSNMQVSVSQVIYKNLL